MDISRFMQALRQGAVDPWHTAHYHGGGKGAAPPAPDYTGAAQAQAAGSQAAQTQATYANRPTVNTPWGQQSWETGTAKDPTTGNAVTTWQQNINLSPEQAAAQKAQADITQGRSEAAKTLLGQATGGFETPFDWQGLPETPGSLGGAQQSAYEKMSAMLEPGRERARSSLDTKLANMGLARGTEAFKNAQSDQGDIFAQQDKSVLAQALSEGRSDVNAQQQIRQASIAEQAQRRGMPLNELNALLTGQQVGMPGMPDFKAAGAAQGPQLLDAATAAGQYGMNAATMKANAAPDYGALLGTAAMGAGMAGIF